MLLFSFMKVIKDRISSSFLYQLILEDGLYCFIIIDFTFYFAKCLFNRYYNLFYL